MNRSSSGGAAPVEQPPQARQRPSQPPLDLIQQVGGWMVMLFVFTMYTRLPEYLPFRAHLPLILMALVLVSAVFTNGILRALRSKQALLLVAFTGWFLVTIPFSYWRRGSLMLLTDSYSVAFLCFFGVTALLTTLQQLRQLTWVMAAGTCVIAGLALFYGSETLDRLAVSSEISASFDNANALGLFLVFGLPFCVLVALDPTRVRPMRALAGVASAFATYATLLTGSRMGLLGLIVLAMVFALRGSLKRALFGAALLVAAFAVLFALMPEKAVIRYRTMVQSDQEQIEDASAGEDPVAAAEQLNKASSSTGIRKAAILAGIDLAYHNPVVGVGPGQFGTAMAQGQNHALAWMQPHNTYTQLSSEMGLPGFVLYVWAVIYSIRACHRILRASRGRPDMILVSRLALCLFASFLALAVMGMFAHLAYSILAPLLCGMTVVLERVSGYATVRPVSAVSYASPQRPPAARITAGRRTARR